MIATAQATMVLADLVNEPGGGKGEDFGKAAPIALVVLILFFIAVAFLIRSMTRHLKKVPGSFDPEEQARLEAEEKRAAESGEPPPKPMNSVRAKAMARAEARARAAGEAEETGEAGDAGERSRHDDGA